MSREITGHTYTDIQELWKWCAELEARQRAYGMHDPGCPWLQEEKHYAKFFDYMPASRSDCNCWLTAVKPRPTS